MSNQLPQLADLHAALADPGRLRLLCACLDAERCVCQLVELLGLSNAAVSRHLGILRRAGLLASRKRGRWVYYRLSDGDVPPPVVDAIASVRAHATGTPEIQRDLEHLARIDAVDPTELCRRQRDCCTGQACC